MRQLFALFSLLCLSLPAFAQLEVNVMLREPEQALQQYLRSRTQSAATPAPQVVPRALANRVPVLRRLERVQALGSRPDSRLGRIFTLSLSGGELERTLDSLRATGAFAFVEPNRQLQLDALQYEPTDDSLDAQWYLGPVQAFAAWNRTRGDASIRIGIIDTGIDYGHPEFEGQLWINPAEDANGNGTFEPWPSSEQRNGLSGDFDGIDADQNGYTDDVIGYDFTDQPRSPFGGDYLFQDPDPLDDNNHGTLVAGVIGAKHNNGFGGAGLAPDCQLVTLRAFARNGAGDDDDVARAIVYAADNGIDVLNFSFGDIYPSQVMREAVRYADARGVFMTGSAGNGTGDELHYPSGFDEVISVSASTIDRANDREFLWPLSSYGLTVDLCAPGANIFTSTLRDTADDGMVTSFARVNGTSFSAPMVAAAAALLLAERGPRNARQLRALLGSTADDLSSPGWDQFTGAGRLNIGRALSVVGNANVQLSSPEHDSGSSADSVYLIGTVVDPEFQQYALEYQLGTADTSEWQSIGEPGLTQVAADTLGLWDLSGLPEGEYTLRLRLSRSNGAPLEDRIRFVRDISPPSLKIIRFGPVWDNDQRGQLLIFRSDDTGTHRLFFQKNGETSFRSLAFDRNTRNGDFLLGPDLLSAGDYRCYLQTSNLAGMTTRSDTLAFSFQPQTLPSTGMTVKAYQLPMGRLLPETYDFDEDGLPEVLMSRYDEQLAFGPLMSYEFTGGFFTAVDSLDFSPVLIPKDVGDSDGNGLLELLVSVNDSLYVLEQPAAGTFPSTLIYQNLGNTFYAASLRDTDGDGAAELLVKDFEDYFVFGRNGSGFDSVAALPDVSGNYQGSIAPRTAVADFDGDGQMEVVYGDFDGDFLVYEQRGEHDYALTFIDSTDLTKAGNYVTAGDFDGDGRPELFVAAHSSRLRNEDFEYETPHWWLRIFEATGNDSFAVVWEDLLYDIDTENYNAATAGQLDQDPALELVFTTFPRTYLLEWTGSEYAFTWFRYGDVATHHVIGDFDANGIGEVGLGRGDSTLFYEKDLATGGPKPVESLSGYVLGPDRVWLQWEAGSDATSYELWQVRDPENNDTALVRNLGSVTEFLVTGLQSEVPYLFVLRAVNPALSPAESGFGNAILRVPHLRPRLDSLAPAGSRQLEAFFSAPMQEGPGDLSRFWLNETAQPTALVQTGHFGRRLLLSFAEDFTPGRQVLRGDTTLLDARWAFLDPTADTASFVYEPVLEDPLILSRWEAQATNPALSEQEAVLYFNFPLAEAGALDTANYAVFPFGEVTAVAWAGDDFDAVKVTVAGARIGALGYPLSITAGPAVCGIQGVCMGSEGNTATFSSFQDDLSEVYVYPNPYRAHGQFDGIRFANLTRQATVRVLTPSGRLIKEMKETDGDGGLEWDLRDLSGKRVRAGVYLFHVSTEAEGVGEVMGKFSVVE